MIDVRKKILQSNGLPTLPEVALKAIEIVNNSESTIDELSKLIIQDAALSEKILRVANSSFYSLPKKVSNISSAVNIMGMDAVASLVLSISIIDTLKMKNKNYDFNKYWENSLFTGVCSKMIAEKINSKNCEEAFIAGLLCNISYLFMLEHFPDEFREIINCDYKDINRMRLEWEIFGMTHSEISSLMLQAAKLPEVLWRAVENHHSKNAVQSILNEDIRIIAQIVYCASLISSLFYHDHSVISKIRNEINEIIDMDKIDFEIILTSISARVKESASFFGFENMNFPTYFEILEKANQELSKINLNFEDLVKELKIEKEKSIRLSKKLEETNKKLLDIALKDPLTGAYNRRYLNEILDVEISKAKRYNTSLLIITCDIDHFKQVNDTYGHNDGDIVLKRIVMLMKYTLRKTDILSRTGGEEFVIVCHSTDEKDGITIAEKLRQKIESTPIKISDGILLNITMSFGVACYKPSMKNMEDFIKLADKRLYIAKETGRNKVVYNEND